MERSARLATVSASLRWELKLLSPFNDKGIKSEAQGYLQAMLYLAPATLAGGKTVCPYSTEACRDGCLFTAGRGVAHKVRDARLRRTRLYLDDRATFFYRLIEELGRMQRVADGHGLTLAIRLNGTSDIAFEREKVDGGSIFDLFPRARFFDYTRWAEHRHVPGNWHLTYSLADHHPQWAWDSLADGDSVAAIVPDEDRLGAPSEITVGDRTVSIVDGEIHDLRFLDPPGSLVLLRPKGRLVRPGSPMVHPGLIRDLQRISK